MIVGTENEIDFGDEDADLQAIFLSNDEARSSGERPFPIVSEAPEESGTSTIVVTATKQKDDGGFYTTHTVLNVVSSPVTESWSGGGGGSTYSTDPTTGDANDDGVQASVNLDVDDANYTEGVAAAEKIAKAITDIEAFLNDLDPNTPVQWFDGDIMKASEALQMLANTEFIVDDAGHYGNGGVGTAERGTNGAPNTIRLNFDAFDGDGGDYGSSNYTDNQGVVGQILHELGHVTAQGDAFNESSESTYFAQYGSYVGYTYSDYWYNNEAYAYEFAQAMAAAMGFDISQFWGQLDSRYTGGAVSHAEIYNTSDPRTR